MNSCITGKISKFQGVHIPDHGTSAGYAALIEAYNLTTPIPSTLCAIGLHHKIKLTGAWKFFTPRHEPEASLKGHLVFALKYEGVDLSVLYQLFTKLSPNDLIEIIKSSPTSRYLRRIWFLYEWFGNAPLPIPDLKIGNYVEILDPSQQWAIIGERVPRQRVVNNLPGTPLFCPLIFRTAVIDRYIALNLKQKASVAIKNIPKDMINRTAAFLLLKDSQASFTIENESGSSKRIQRWGRALGEAGRNKLDIGELNRLQKTIIGDARFVSLGLRKEGGFVGDHDRDTGVPIPEHISARPEDIQSLVKGLLAFNERTNRTMDPIMAAACIAFGFVFIHPYSDGNGRLHRYLIHHILAENGYNPSGLIFPVSSAMLNSIGEYQAVLQSYSKKVLPLIEWERTRDNNVCVKNRTAVYYQYFDATPLVEYLFYCVQQTIEIDLPNEAAFLERIDAFTKQVNEIADMPNNIVHLLYKFLSQNKGVLSKRARTREFSLLEDGEVHAIENLYKQLFNHNSRKK